MLASAMPNHGKSWARFMHAGAELNHTQGSNLGVRALVSLCLIKRGRHLNLGARVLSSFAPKLNQKTVKCSHKGIGRVVPLHWT